MLHGRNLDDQTYDEIVERAVGRIPQLCPQWTNHNPSDPGITILELMAWYKEMQQYYMNRCTLDIRRKLLALAGGDLRPPAAARCGIRWEQPSGAYPLYARLETPEGIVFELTEAIGAERTVLASGWVLDGESWTDVTPMLERGELGIEPFAFRNAEKTSFLLALDALPSHAVRLWFVVKEPPLPARNPFASPTQTPRTIRWFWEGAGEAEILQDETHALSQSGYITFAVPEGLPRVSLTPGTYWYLRAELETSGCEETVCIGEVYTERYEAVQQETWSQSRMETVSASEDCRILYNDALAADGLFTLFLRTDHGWQQSTAQEVRTADGQRGIVFDSRETAQDGDPNVRLVCSDPIHYADLFHNSTGLPDMTITLSPGGRQVLTDGFRLICDTLCEDGAVRPEEWHCVPDFYASGPRDRVFVYDAAEETLRFGDGRNGAVIPRGEHAIFLSDLTLSMCSGGNIPEGILHVLSDGAQVRCTGASGGRDPESVAAASARFLRRLEHPHKCVSAEDYRREALETPGLRLLAAKVIPGYDPEEPTGRSRYPVVTVVVIPASRSARPMPDAQFLTAVQAHLNRRRPIATLLRVIPPRYVGINVTAQLRTAGHADEEALRRCLERCLTLRRPDRTIPSTVVLHDLIREVQRLPWVLAVSHMELRATDAGCTISSTGDVLLPVDGAAFLDECVFSFR